MHKVSPATTTNMHSNQYKLLSEEEEDSSKIVKEKQQEKLALLQSSNQRIKVNKEEKNRYYVNAASVKGINKIIE